MKHAEAWCLMTYTSEDLTICERLWNSRDGVTPFIINSRDNKHQLKHNPRVEPDQLNPFHMPEEGDRIFIDLTWPRAKEVAAYAMERFKKQGTPLPDGQTEWEVENSVALDIYRDGNAPHIIVVDAELAGHYRNVVRQLTPKTRFA